MEDKVEGRGSGSSVVIGATVGIAAEVAVVLPYGHQSMEVVVISGEVSSGVEGGGGGAGS